MDIWKTTEECNDLNVEIILTNKDEDTGSDKSVNDN